MPEDSFPIMSNSTIIPPDFAFRAIDLCSTSFSCMKQIGCRHIIAVDSPPGWKIYRNGQETRDIGFVYPITGSMELKTAGGSTLTARKGQLLIVPSWQERIISIDTPCYHIYVNFSYSECHSDISQIELRDVRHADAIAFYTSTLLDIQSFHSYSTAYQSNVATGLSMLLQQDLHSKPQLPSEERIQKLLALLNRSSTQELTVSRLARNYGMSLTSFRTFCHEHFQHSPGELIQEEQMSRAKALLGHSDYSIDDIAVQLGYADRFAFSKAFSRSNHLTPVQYRKATIRRLSSD